jgi:hypothetical protein
MDTILRSEAKKIIDSGVPFSLSFIKADRRRGLAGEYAEVKHWQKVTAAAEAEAIPNQPELKPELVKNPNHWANKTFNIYDPADPKQHPVKVHYRLMHVFNEKLIVQ